MTDNPSKEFEKEVGRLLRLSGRDVQAETLLGHKKIDLLVTETHFGADRRLAVECKLMNRPITKNQLLKIYVDYKPLYDANLVDEVLVVTKNGLTASAQTLVQETRHFSHQTHEELVTSLLDLDSYVANLSMRYELDGLAEYYIPPLTAEGDELEGLILSWIQSDEPTPVAILGSYGIGKTTFAKRLSNVLAQQIGAHEIGRLPILVPLGEISSEQSLEGLLGKLFTARTPVRNYSFELFMRLNESGRFVVILDGFDEMKHTLTWEAFKYNFRQLNRLVAGSSKVLILGRPTAFLNDREYRHALRGERSIGQETLREPGWPAYKEYHLQPFTQDQAEEFLRKYLAYKSRENLTDKELDRIQTIVQKDVSYLVENSDLSTRPVQLVMLAEVLPSYTGDVRSLSEASLYNLFIDLMIEREQEKLARQRFTTSQRRNFARDLALFLWENKSEMSITADALPAELLTSYASPTDDLEGVRRDLVAACFLERKLGEALYFPHRSFQEFLVAEAIIPMVRNKDVRRADTLLTQEVAEFLIGLIHLEDIRSWSDAFTSYRGTISGLFAHAMTSEPSFIEFYEHRLRLTRSPWFPLLTALGVSKGVATDELRRMAIAGLRDKMKKESGSYNIISFVALLSLSDLNEVHEEALLSLVRTKRYSPSRDRFNQEPDPTALRLLLHADVDETTRVVNLTRLYAHLDSELANYCGITTTSEITKIGLLPDILSLPKSVRVSNVRPILRQQRRYPGKIS